MGELEEHKMKFWIDSLNRNVPNGCDIEKKEKLGELRSLQISI